MRRGKAEGQKEGHMVRCESEPIWRGPLGTAPTGRAEGGRTVGGRWGWGTGDRGLGFLRLDFVILVHKLLASVPPVACGISLSLHFPIHWCA